MDIYCFSLSLLRTNTHFVGEPLYWNQNPILGWGCSSCLAILLLLLAGFLFCGHYLLFSQSDWGCICKWSYGNFFKQFQAFPPQEKHQKPFKDGRNLHPRMSIIYIHNWRLLHLHPHPFTVRKPKSDPIRRKSRFCLQNDQKEYDPIVDSIFLSIEG